MKSIFLCENRFRITALPLHQKQKNTNMKRILNSDVTNEVKNIVVNFALKYRGVFQYSKAMNVLVASLYVIKRGSEAKAEVVCILESIIVNLKDFFENQELSILLENYQEVIEYALDYYNSSIQEKSAAIISQPKELTTFINEMMDVKSGSKVYLPFAGLATEAIELENCNITGEEMSLTAWALGQILLDAYDVKNDIVLGDSFESLANVDNLYDYIIFNPPFAIKHREDSLSEIDAVKLAFDNKLKDGGWMCCVLSQGFLFNSGKDKHLREYFIDNGYLRSIILMPKIFAPITSINPIVLVLEKKKSDRFVLVDGKEFSVKNKVNNGTLLKVSSLLEAINTFDEKYCKALMPAELSGDYNLSPYRYLYKLPKTKANETLYKLKDIVSFVGHRLTGKDAQKNISFAIKELSDNYLNCEVVKSDIEAKPHFVYSVIESCLTAQPLFEKVKIGKLEIEKETNIGTYQETFFFQPKKEIIEETYLLKALVSDYVVSQVKAFSIGTTIKRLSKEDFLNLMIPVPSLDIQKEGLMSGLERELKRTIKLREKEHEEYVKDVHVKKHAIGQMMFGLNNSWSLLDDLRKEFNGNLNENVIIGDGEDKMSIKDILDNIGLGIMRVSKAIESFTVGEDIIYKEEDLALAPFFENYCNTHKSHRYTITFQAPEGEYADKDLPVVECDENGIPVKISDTDFILREGDATSIVKFSSNALERILDNICANAVAYGFVNRDTHNNNIRITMESHENSYIVCVSNNGMPANEKLDTKDIFNYGVTTSNSRGDHSGIGCYEIMKLMERFGGKVEFVNDPGSEYPVTYKLIFNNTNILLSI